MTTYRNYVVVVALLVAACSSSMQGEYTNNSGALGAGALTYKFKSGGKVEMITNTMGMQQIVELDYKLEDGNVKIIMPGGVAQILPIDKSGCLESVIGKLCKKKV